MGIDHCEGNLGRELTEATSEEIQKFIHTLGFQQVEQRTPVSTRAFFLSFLRAVFD